jgi:hypothetical protein
MKSFRSHVNVNVKPQSSSTQRRVGQTLLLNSTKRISLPDYIQPDGSERLGSVEWYFE